MKLRLTLTMCLVLLPSAIVAQPIPQSEKAPCPPASSCEESTGPKFIYPLTDPQLPETDDQYRQGIGELLRQRDFSELDRAANSARETKGRLGGGIWKLYVFYDVVANPAGTGTVSNQTWLNRLALLNEWVAAAPSSVTARVALGTFYQRYAWAARGEGYANTVSASSWALFKQRTAQAYQALLDADKLSPKCPHWYFVMLDVVQDLGGSKEQMRELFDQGIALEPGYYHLYREFANNLLPKWMGEPGESEAFAEESLQRIGGDEGTFVYFEIASTIYCDCGNGGRFVRPTLSWPVIQKGFAIMESRYGATPLKLNRLALLAFLYQDRAVANQMLDRMGDSWEPRVWSTRDRFERFKLWAGR